MTPVGWVFFAGFWLSVVLNVVLLIWVSKLVAEVDTTREILRTSGQSHVDDIYALASRLHRRDTDD